MDKKRKHTLVNNDCDCCFCKYMRQTECYREVKMDNPPIWNTNQSPQYKKER